jgi:phage shock protein C
VRTRDRVVAGVCGGLARYLGVDPVLLRVAAVVVAFLTGFAPVIVGYVVAWIVVPEEDAAGGRPVARSPGSPDGARNVLGIVLIVAGGVVLLQRVSPWWFRGDLLLPLILVAIGVAVVVQGVRR